MRTARIKVNAGDGEAIYHLMTRVVNGERVIHTEAKEVLRRQLWQVADYCGVELLTYAILSNHFHALVRVPRFCGINDAELLRRYRVLYPRPTRYQQARLEVIESQLRINGPDAVRWRRRQLALMHDISGFMRLVKQRYSVWHNKRHNRFGTLWAERFKSVLVEPQSRVVSTIAGYIDLNCVRAGLARDPKDYRFCGYAEAVAGNDRARAGLCAAFGVAGWAECSRGYRLMLFGRGAESHVHGRGISTQQFERVMAAGGKLPLTDVLRCRVRYFADAAVLGSRLFVTHHLHLFRTRHNRRHNREVHVVPPVTEWGDLTALRPVRRRSFL